MTELVPADAPPLPALLDHAERALALVETPDDAEDLWRKVAAVEHAARLARAHGETQLRVGRLKLRAERRWGELLGDAEPILPPPGGVTSGNAMTGSDRVARHRAREVAAVPGDVFDRYLRTVRDAEMLRRARLLRVAREKRSGDANAELVTAVGDVEIRHGDFRDSLTDLVGMVDAVITDPPYPQEFRHLYAALAETAARLLTPEGALVVMCGTRPDAWLRLIPDMDEHLPLRWVGCYLATGPAWRDHKARVSTNWKPILIFGHGPGLTTDVWRSRADSAQTRTRDLEWHKWGQNAEGFGALVEAFVPAGGLVVDPFLGGGTTAVVCRDLGRRFVGCDVDAAAVNATLERLAA